MENISNEKETFSAEKKISESREGWLTPKGKFYECSSKDHDLAAKYVMEKEKVAEDAEEGINPRAELKRNGYLLLTGSVVHSDIFMDLTPIQLKLLKEAKINVSLTGSIEAFPADVALAETERLQKICESFRQNLLFTAKREIVEKKLKEKSLDIDINKNTKDSLELDRDIIMDYIPGFYFDSIASFNRFQESPFTSGSIQNQEYAFPDGDHDLFTDALFDELTERYDEEVTYETGSHYVTKTRLVPTKNSKVKTKFSYSIYSHDMSNEWRGDFNYHIRAKLVTKDMIKEDFSERFREGSYTNFKHVKKSPNGFFNL